MVSVRLDNIWMSFGKLTVLKGINLDIKEGEFTTLLGPSGCGKTTLLRIIAGLYKPVKGRILFNDRDVTDLPPWERNVGFVFQDYALWPHMNVFENIAYGLRIRKIPSKEIKKRVREVLEFMGLNGLEYRYPYQLSGGQQQRVALARAIVINPSLLLLDEPLSNLDAKIRVSVRTEIKKLQKRLKITTIYVTHDQEEALVISDRIAVINRGVIEQLGTPWELYYYPRTPFVADFIGQVNMFEGKILGFEKGFVLLDTPIGLLQAKADGRNLHKNENVYVVFRPEIVRVHRSEPTHSKNSMVLKGKIDVVQFLGNLLRLEIQVGKGMVRAEIHNPYWTGMFKAGEEVHLSINLDHLIVLKRS
ncbi:MAG: ABC transporter ATP-binding protein [Thermoprotei archaeon]|nr:MAG: ABC transporter ATP-binding protein [Thermoprotei archaeon]